jgi:hypothetical protein
MILDGVINTCTLGYVHSDFNLSMCRYEMKLAFKIQNKRKENRNENN